jgi:hypothetical protein
VSITAADAADDSAPVLGPIDLPLTGGTNYTAVAHLHAAGARCSTVVSGLENPDEATLDLPPGTVWAAVASAGTTDPLISPAGVPVVDGRRRQPAEHRLRLGQH